MVEGGSPSLTYLSARLVISGVLGSVFFLITEFLLQQRLLTGPNNLLYLTLVGLLFGYLVSAPLARRWEVVWFRIRSTVSTVTPETVLAAGTGATIALLIAVLLNNLLARMPGFTWYWSLLIATLLLIASSWFFVANRQLLTFIRQPVEDRPTVRHRHPRSPEKIADTSAIIDGRIVDILETNFMESPLLIPKFVLGELQTIADSDDPPKRRRGRRGLEILDQLIERSNGATHIIYDNPLETSVVDEKLIALCLQRRACLVTTDYNLDRVANLQGVKVLNVNRLANAIRAIPLPGERLSLKVVREGRRLGQGLAYLDDGTMVVVDGAADKIGHILSAVVTSRLQTDMGVMIFAKPDPEGERALDTPSRG